MMNVPRCDPLVECSTTTRIRVKLQRNEEQVKRSYRSPARERQVEATRAAILDAARELFLANGYAGTSVKAIAKRAEVAEQTVYNAFGDKASLLFAVGERIVNRQDDPARYMETAAVEELRAEPDPVERIRIVARWASESWEQGMLEFETMLFGAMHDDDRLRETADRALQSKREAYDGVAAILFPDDLRRHDVALDDVTDLMLAIDSAPTVRFLIEDCAWTYDKYEDWLVELMCRTFLSDGGASAG